MSKQRLFLIVILGLLLFGVLPADLLACPTCKDGIAGNDPAHTGMVRGYFWSIVFMMSMPFTILTALSAYFYYEVCRARRSRRLAVALDGD